MLPDGRSVLFTVTRQQGPRRWDHGEVAVQSLSSDTRTVVVKEASAARYLSSGHLVYAVRDGLFGGAFSEVINSSAAAPARARRAAIRWLPGRRLEFRHLR